MAVLGVRIDELPEAVSVRLGDGLPDNQLEMPAHKLPQNSFIRLECFVGPRDLVYQLYKTHKSRNFSLSRFGLGVFRLDRDIGNSAQRPLDVRALAIGIQCEKAGGLVELVVFPRSNKTPRCPPTVHRYFLEDVERAHKKFDVAFAGDSLVVLFLRGALFFSPGFSCMRFFFAR